MRRVDGIKGVSHVSCFRCEIVEVVVLEFTVIGMR